MYYSSKEFISDLKMYNFFKDKVQGLDELLKIINHNLYRKIKSPLDYDIAIDANGNEIRQIKGRTNIDQIQIIELREKFQKEKTRVVKLKKYYINKISNIDKTLDQFNEDIKTYMIEIFINGASYDSVARKYESKGISKSSLYRMIRKAIDDAF